MPRDDTQGHSARDDVQRALQQPEKGTNHGEGGKPASPEKGLKASTKDDVTDERPSDFSLEEAGDATWPLNRDAGNTG